MQLNGNRFTAFLLALVVLVASCNSTEKGSDATVTETSFGTAPTLEKMVKIDEDSSKIIYQLDKLSGKKYGLYEVYAQEGHIIERCSYRNDTLDGDKQLFFANGKVEEIMVYKDGKLQGDAQKFYETGVLKKECRYENNELVGLLKVYYEDGSIKEQVTVKNNLLNGPFEEYAEGGKLKIKGNYISLSFEQEGLEDGLLEEYDIATGELMVKKFCKKGICCKVWTKEEGDVESKSDLCPEIVAAYKQSK